MKGANAGGLAHLATRSSRPSTTRPRRSWASPARRRPHPFAEPRSKPYPLPPLRRAPDRAGDRPGVQGDRRGTRSPPRAASLSKPYKGRARVHVLRAVRQLRLRDGRQVRHQRQPHPRRAGHRQRGAAPRVHGALHRGGRATAAPRASSTWTRTASRRSSRRRSSSSPAPRWRARGCCSTPPPAASPRGWPTAAGWWARTCMFSSFGEAARHLPHRPSRRQRGPGSTTPRPFVNRSLQDFYLMPDDALRLPQGRHAGLHVDAPQPHLRGGGPGRLGQGGRVRQGAEGPHARVPRLADPPVRDLRRVPRPPPGTYVSRGAGREGQVRPAGGGHHRRPAPHGPRRRRASSSSAARRCSGAWSRTSWSGVGTAGRDHHPPARHLPLRQRPGHLRARQGLPRPRGAQPLRGGRQLHAHQRRRALHPHHRGQHLPRREPDDRAAEEGREITLLARGEARLARKSAAAAVTPARQGKRAGSGRLAALLVVALCSCPSKEDKPPLPPRDGPLGVRRCSAEPGRKNPRRPVFSRPFQGEYPVYSLFDHQTPGDYKPFDSANNELSYCGIDMLGLTEGYEGYAWACRSRLR